MTRPTKPLAVPDSTVYFSAIARNGLGAPKVLSQWREGKFEICTSESITEEILSVLDQGGAPVEATQLLISEIRRKAHLIQPGEKITDCRDPDDNKILEAAVAGQADYIVSDDKDLRVLSPFRGIEILTVNRFLRRLGIPRRVRNQRTRRIA